MKYTCKTIYGEPYWRTIHPEYCLLQYTVAETGDHPIYFKWSEVSDLKLKNIESITECVFKLNLEHFGMMGHEIPVLNFLNDKFQWLFYTLDEENKVVEVEGKSYRSEVTKFEGDLTWLKEFNHCDYQTESTTAKFKGQSLTISKNDEVPLLKKLSQEEVDAYMKTQEWEEELDDWKDPMSYFIAFNEGEKPIPQDDQHALMEIYLYKSSFKDYFGALPNRNQNNFEIPVIEGREMPFVGQFNDGMFGGYDTYNFIFYDKETRTVGIFQQTT